VTADLTFTRDFEAPRELIFKVFLDPSHFVRFWGPVGTHATSVVIEPWPGGRFENVMVSDADGSSYAFRATFLSVVEPALFSWKEHHSGLTSQTTLIDLGGGRTRVVIHQTDVPEGYRSPEARAGFRTALDRLAAYLATL
jgi:uncharacterized protein YndB with AHSA1/START domain